MGKARKGGGNQKVTVTYSDEAINELLFMIEEEKLAGDIYEAFYDMFGLKVFKNIAKSEDKHFNTLVKQAEKLNLDIDEILFEPAGSYVNDDVQELYDTLLEQGSQSVTDALNVGVYIEEKDLVDLQAAADLVEGTRLELVYERLMAGSQNHLDAFEAGLA